MLLGIDLARRDVATILADAQGRAELALRADLPREGGTPAQWLAAMSAARETMLRAQITPERIQCVALTIDAPLDAQGVVQKSSRAVGWEGFDVPDALRKHLHIAQATTETRLIAEALGEARFGALRPSSENITENITHNAANAASHSATPHSATSHSATSHSATPYNAASYNAREDWLYVHIGHHLGAVAQVNGQLLRGANNAAGEIGALCIDRDGALTASGRRGGLSGYCTYESFLSRAATYGITNQSAMQIWETYDSNFAARSLCDEFTHRLAQGLGAALTILNPAKLVVGGSLVTVLGETLMQPLRMRIKEFCLSAHVSQLQISAGQLGNDAAALGAIALALQTVESS